MNAGLEALLPHGPLSAGHLVGDAITALPVLPAVLMRKVTVRGRAAECFRLWLGRRRSRGRRRVRRHRRWRSSRVNGWPGTVWSTTVSLPVAGCYRLVPLGILRTDLLVGRVVAALPELVAFLVRIVTKLGRASEIRYGCLGGGSWREGCWGLSRRRGG